MSHLLEAIREDTPQTEAYREDQVQNSAGGFSWEVDNWTKFKRFLILGSDGGTFYASERKITKSGINSVKKCIHEDGLRAVSEIVRISQEGIAPKNDYAILALALAVSEGTLETKREALKNLSKVCRTGTHLFQFCEFLNELGSLTGRAKRRALAEWYTNKDPKSLAYQVIKYRQRNGWTHRDVLRIAHPARKVTSGNPVIGNLTDEHQNIFRWIAGGEYNASEESDLISAFESVQKASDKKVVVENILKYRLPREAIPTEFLNEVEVWDALLRVDMPYTALIRNLANMTRIGLLTGTSDATKFVVEKLNNEEGLAKARVHPINVLFALKTYASGKGFRGSNTWTPVSQIIDALNDAFYKSFRNVEPTNKRILLSLDISSSMTWGNVGGTNLTPRDGSGAMALVTAATEKSYDIVGFSTSLISLDISPKMRLDTVIRNISGLPFGGTDCSLPMESARKYNREYDAFVIYTDSETWAGRIHPAKALQKYREKTGIDAKLVVVGMVANDFSIADPKDAGMLDVVGFDTTAPQLISNFIAGRV
jgi:60 kDa SS-A/Ro ribonucleoprotein